MPHGGPASRDEWGFDWLSQFFAANGYAVIQPNYRGSTGYGEAWFQKNGFKSWQIAISDVNDSARWLIGQGVADPGAWRSSAGATAAMRRCKPSVPNPSSTRRRSRSRR